MANPDTKMEPLRVGLFLFPGFQPLDAVGPLDLLNVMALYFHIPLKLSIIAPSKDQVSPGLPTGEFPDSFRAQQRYVPTHTIEDAPSLDLLMVPGGRGTRAREALQPSLDYLRKAYDGYDGHPPVKYVFSVCTGSALLAMAGILDGQRATSNKLAWQWATSTGPKTHWVAKARWVTSGRVWTTSGVTAGIDGMAALVAHIYGEELAGRVCDYIEHVRITDPTHDPFAAMNECQDVPPTSA